MCTYHSYKNGGRCLVGIEVRKTFNGYNIVMDYDGSPKWIRSVLVNDNHRIPENMFSSFGMFNIFDIDVINDVPSIAHSENALLKRINKVGHHNGSLTALCDENHL